MAKRYRVPKRKTPLRIRIASGKEEVVSIFLSEFSANHAGPEKPLEFFNGDSAFIVAEAHAGNVIFICREFIDVVTIDIDGNQDGIAADTNQIAADLEIEVAIAVELADGRVLEGFVRYQLPESNSRLGDYLNTPQLFLPLYQRDRMHLLNKRRIARVCVLEEKSQWRASIS